MKKQGISLGRIFGIPIGLDYSWFLVFFLITFTLASSYFPREFRNWPVQWYWITAAFTAVALFASVLLHELGHSVVAMRYKIPVRSITLFIFGGVAQIGKEPTSAASEFWIAIAGPFVSFSLAAIFRVLQVFVGSFAPVFALVEYLAYINGSLALFNLIPGFPLDGGRIFRAFIWGITGSMRKATNVAAWSGRIIAFGFILLGVWQVFTGNLANGLWIAFIGWFLENAASAQVQQQSILDLLSGHTVSQAMTRSYALVPAELTLQELADEYILRGGQRYFGVERDGHVIGLVTVMSMKNVDRSEWTSVRLEKVMTPLSRLHVLQSDTELSQAMQEMQADGVNLLPVVDDGRLTGILTRQGINNFMGMLKEMA